MPYKDFEITIAGADKEGRHSIIGKSPTGGFAGTFVNPIMDVDFEKLVAMGLRVRSAKDKGETYLFSWDNVPVNDNERLVRFLRDELAIGWAKNAEISKSDDGKTIRIFNGENSAEIMIDEKEEKATLKISDGRTHDLKVKKENGKLNIYRETRPVKSTDDLGFLGDRLSEALFQSNVLGAYAQNKGALKPEEGLRLRIRIDPNMSEYTKLMNLPWEFLKDVQTRERIELVLRRAIVRDPITVAPTASFAVKPPVRILAAICQPSGYPPLQLDDEILSLVKTAEETEITVKFIKDVTLGALDDEMSEEEYHIFHFIGHGGLNSDGRSALVFKEDGENTFIDADRLRVVLTDSIRLVFLNACATASIPVVEPFAAFPTELLNRGIPAVIAMQFPISNEAATAFCSKFYTRMAKGIPIDQCMGEARRSVFLSRRRAEWGTPVLFMNSPDGILFNIEEIEKFM